MAHQSCMPVVTVRGVTGLQTLKFSLELLDKCVVGILCEMYLHVFICLPCTANSMFYFSHLNISCCKLSFCQTWFVHILPVILKFSD